MGGIQEQKVLNWLLRVYKRLFYGKKNKFDRGLPFALWIDGRKPQDLVKEQAFMIVLGDVKVGENTVLEIAGVQIYSVKES